MKPCTKSAGCLRPWRTNGDGGDIMISKGIGGGDQRNRSVALKTLTDL